ncbi:MAG: UPF0182 family protein [Syntrophomonadaceae bacterium]|nr:UPF0182 family protein [Syntrophomonadaceae bacterium]
MAEARGSLSRTMKLVLVLVALGLASIVAGLYADWLWFDSLSYGRVFNTILLNKVGLYLIIFVATFLFLYFNLALTRRHRREEDRPPETDEGREIIYLESESIQWRDILQGRTATWVFLAVSLLAALMLSSASSQNWIIVQQFINRVAMGTTDPIFHKDLAFYFFNLSFYHYIYGIIMSLLVLTLIATAAVYMVNASVDIIFGEWKEFNFAKGHLALLLVGVLALKAWGYKLATYDILFSPSGLFYGAAYTDIYGRLMAYKVLMIVSLLVALVIIANLFIKRLNWIAVSLGAWLVLAILLNGLYPAILQKLVVQPNQFNKEKPYIENAIKYTRMAYNLDRVDNNHFNISYNLNIGSESNRSIIQNIRLWDWDPLRTTYRNLQQLRPYYVFNDVDIDRYQISNSYRQVMLSARELDQDQLPTTAKTWVNQRLFYTHGYGVVVSPVNAIGEEGFPDYFIKDVPPRSSTDLIIKRPEIYFGESDSSYVMVNTAQKEFDYPMGDKNVYSTYEGKQGLKIQSFGRRLLLAWVLKDYKMLLSSDINNSSQVLMYRNIVDRAQKIAPYLTFDSDPYIVIGKDGRLYWMMDAYTVTDKYPYSQPYADNGNNYIRNSVKVSCDAYTGEILFYLADNSDPIIKTYSKIFPGLFRPLTELPDGLSAHLRYPEDIFSVQAEIFKTFHMTDPSVFYNKEDPWLVPVEKIGGEAQTMSPYYMIMRLPESEQPEYVLMLPYTPKGRPNMIAWMCARMDGDNYGKLLVYDFPKQETIYGPEQIESRIDQDTEISQQFSLWDQGGSNVYRGNLLVIPMDNSILYIEPIYLQAENSRLPELKRIIAGFGDKVVMEPSLDRALKRLFGESNQETALQPDVKAPERADTGTENIDELVKLARQYYDKANQLLKQGDWAGYGENITKLNDVIRRLEDKAK